jgi:deazaflavin-dependent oxidoreductase (nitroreductase family)
LSQFDGLSRHYPDQEVIVPFPSFLPAFNRRVTNRITGRFAGKIAPFAIVHHTGRASGKHYASPIMAFPTATGFVIALTYGAETDWIRNVLAAGGCALTYRRRMVELVHPRVVEGSPRDFPFPRWVGTILGSQGVHEFLLLDRAADQ